MESSARADGACDVLWVLNFEPHDEHDVAVIRSNVLAMYETGLAGLERAASLV